MGKDKAYYPEVKDQTSLVSSSDKNLALNKKVYVSSTGANEGTDPTVLKNGHAAAFSPVSYTHLFSVTVSFFS